MKMRFPFLVPGLAFVLAFAAPALAQDAPAIDLKGMADALKKIKTQRAAAEKALELKVVQDLRISSASNAAAVAFYQSALMATQGKDASEVQDLAKSEAVQNAARLHLGYLLMTIQRALGATTKQLEPGLMAHIAALTAAGAGDTVILFRRERNQELKEAGYRIPNAKGKTPPGKEALFWEQGLINQSVKNSVFVQWYGIAAMLADVKDWEMSPGNVDGIYQNTLLPYYRQTKDARVLAYWDQKLKDEAQKASASGAQFKIDQFNKVRRPQLLWKRAQDELTIGLRNRGMTDMMELVKTCPDHPDLNDWIVQLEGMLNPSAKPAASPSPEGANPQG